MADNFFLDNADMQFRLMQLDLEELVDIKEHNYRYASEYPAAPRHYRDAKDNYRLLLEVLGELCSTLVAPEARIADEFGAQYQDGQVTYAPVTQKAIASLRQAGLMGVMLPWEYGGMNLPESIYQMMVEIVSRAEAGLMTIFGLQEIAAAINEYGDEPMKERILARFSRGELTGAMVLTEPDAGSDLGSVKTKATFDEVTGKWYLNGVKRFITNGNADIHLVLARSEDGSSDARGLSLFLVESDETVRVRRIENKMGMRASPTCEIQYHNTPAELIGKRRYGLLRYAMSLMNGARLAVAAQALGIAEAAYREAYCYANQRKQFGGPISKLPAVARMLLTMRGEIEAARALIAETGRWVDLSKAYEQLLAERPVDSLVRQKQRTAASLAETLTPLAKFYATEMGNRVCYLAMQIHGGAGYMREFNIERHFRDVRVTSIYEGTSQMQVVAAQGKLLGHALDVLLDEWADLVVDIPLLPLHKQLKESTALFKQATDALKAQSRLMVDYYASDLADMAVYLVGGWLLLKDARLENRKLELLRVYLAQHLPEVHAKGTILLQADPAGVQASESILSV